jgi:hypothetical protein
MMIEISMIRDLVAIFGVIAGFTYYVLTVQNTRKNQQHQLETRQAQLLMQIYGTLYTEDTWKNYLESFYETKFSDFQDFQEKYGRDNPDFYSKILSVWWSYNTVGGLLRQGLLNGENVSELMGTMIERQWEKWGDIIRELRVDLGSPTTFIEFEYLYNQMKKIRTSEHEAERLRAIVENK